MPGPVLNTYQVSPSFAMTGSWTLTSLAEQADSANRPNANIADFILTPCARAPDRHAIHRLRGPCHHEGAGIGIPLARQHAVEGSGGTQRNRDLVGAIMLPSAGGGAGNRAIGSQLDALRSLDRRRNVLAVIDHLVCAGGIGSGHLGRQRRRVLAERGVAERRNDDPTVFVDEHLVHADLVELAGAREAR